MVDDHGPQNVVCKAVLSGLPIKSGSRRVYVRVVDVFCCEAEVVKFFYPHHKNFMTKWEYKIYVWPELNPTDGVPLCESPQSVEAILNRLGVAGWELVGYETLALSHKNFAAGMGAFTFKRPIE